MKVLVVGANGQLGAACCRLLAASGYDVRGSVRDLARARGLDLEGVELVQFDVTTRADPRLVLRGVDAVVLTANSAVPRRGDSPSDFARGVTRLVDEVSRTGVQRVVLPSIGPSDVDEQVPLVAERRRLETQVLAACPGSVVLRLPPFMECWLALAGSSIPLRGERNATIGRPSPFLRAFRRATSTLVERRGILLVPGPRSARQSFISIADVATAVVATISRPELAGQVIEVAGPEVLTWAQVASSFSQALGRRVRIVSTPAAVYATAATLLAPVAPVPSRTMALNRFVAASQSDWSPPGGGLVDPAQMTTLDQFLAAKMALPARLSSNA